MHQLKYSNDAVCCVCRGPLRHILHYKHTSSEFRSVYPASGLYACSACDLTQVDHHSIKLNRLGEYYEKDYRTVIDAGVATAGSTDPWYVARAEALSALVVRHKPGVVNKIFEVGAGYGTNLIKIGELFPMAELITDEVDQSISLPARVVHSQIEDVGPVDIVIMSHVLEHFLFPVDIMHRVISNTRCGGLIIVEVPNDDSRVLARQESHEPHVTFFDYHNVRRFLEKFRADVDVVSVQTAGPSRVWVHSSLKRAVKRKLGSAFRVVRAIYGRMLRPSLDFTDDRDSDDGLFLRFVLRKK